MTPAHTLTLASDAHFHVKLNLKICVQIPIAGSWFEPGLNHLNFSLVFHAQMCSCKGGLWEIEGYLKKLNAPFLSSPRS